MILGSIRRVGKGQDSSVSFGLSRCEGFDCESCHFEAGGSRAETALLVASQLGAPARSVSAMLDIRDGPCLSLCMSGLYRSVFDVSTLSPSWPWLQFFLAKRQLSR